MGDDQGTPTQSPTRVYLTAEAMRALGNDAFCPKDSHIAYVQAYLTASPNAKTPEIAASAGLIPSTVYNWFGRSVGFIEWFNACLMTAIGNQMPAVWDAVKVRAEHGSDRAAHMIAMRFDLPYREAIQKDIKSGPKRGTRDSTLGGVLAEMQSKATPRKGEGKRAKQQGSPVADAASSPLAGTGQPTHTVTVGAEDGDEARGREGGIGGGVNT